MGFLDYTSSKYQHYFSNQSNRMLTTHNRSNHSSNQAHVDPGRSLNVNHQPYSANNTSAMVNDCSTPLQPAPPLHSRSLALAAANAVAARKSKTATNSSSQREMIPPSSKRFGQQQQDGHKQPQHHIGSIISPPSNNLASNNNNDNKLLDYSSQNSSDATIMPNEEELDKLFAKVLATMDLPPDKSKVLWSYDKDKKWELIRDQRKVQAKQEPRYYLGKLRSYMNNPNGKLRQQVTSRFQVSKKHKDRKVGAENGQQKNNCSTQILRDLEISLRTNSIEWVRDFLSDKNNGLDALVDFLIFRIVNLRNGHMSTISSMEAQAAKQSISDLQQSITLGSNQLNQALKTDLTLPPSTIDRLTNSNNGKQTSSLISVAVDDIHVCIMCLRSIMNNKKGFNMVMEHPQAINCLALSLNHTSIRTKTLVLELLAAICLVKGGHELIMVAFDNFKTTCKERLRFETLIYYFKNQEKFSVEFMVSCLQFINIVVHSQDDMNYRTHLQYEFTSLGLDEYLEKLKQNESEELQVQIQTYLDNRIDVSALAEEAEIKNSALEQVQQLMEKLSISNELQSQLQLNYQALDCRLQEELKRNEELTKSIEINQKQLSHPSKQAAPKEMKLGEAVSNDSLCSKCATAISSKTNPIKSELQASSKSNSVIVPIKSAHDAGVDRSAATTRILVNCDSGSSKAPAAPAPPPPPPPPPPPVPSSAIPNATSSSAPAPPPPPLPPMALGPVGHKKGMAPLPPPMQQLAKTTRQLQNQAKPSEGALAPNSTSNNINCDMMTLKKTFSTQYKLPTFNWSTLKPNQVRGTIFNEFHDEEKIIKSIDFKEFEEQFKLNNRSNRTGSNARNNLADESMNGTRDDSNNSGSLSNGSTHTAGFNGTGGSNTDTGPTKRFKQPEKISFMEHNRLRNMAISLRKLATPTNLLVSAINRLDIDQMSLDSIEILMRMTPAAQEVQAYRDYEAQGKPIEALTDEDRFLCQMSKIDRLDQKVKIMFYMKNLDVATNHGNNSLSSSHSLSSSNTESADLLAATKTKIEFIETASKSLRTSEGIRILLEYILVFGNYLNSSSRSLASAPAYGFKLQALDMVTEARSTQDKSRNLLHFIVDTVMKNLSAKERASLSSISASRDTTAEGEEGYKQQSEKRGPPSGLAGVKRVSPLAAFDQESVKMPYEFDALMVELEQAANVSLETLLIEVKEFERGMELCSKELQLRYAAAEALEQQRQQQQQSNNPDFSDTTPNSIKSPADESIHRLQNFIQSRSSDIAEIKSVVQRAQAEFNECAQYFGENPRTIESSSLFSIFLRHLKSFRQCQIDNKMIEKRKFDEELRKQIQQQQALRAQKKRVAANQAEQRLVSDNDTDSNSNNVGHNGSYLAKQGSNRGSIIDPKQIDAESGRLLHQDEVSHGTLDILITGLKVEPYRRVEGLRKSLRRLERQAGAE